MKKWIAAIGIIALLLWSFERSIPLFVIEEVEASIAVDNTSASGAKILTDPWTWSHTVSGENTVLVVAVASYTDPPISVDFNGDVLTNIPGATIFNGSFDVSIWYLINPDSGTHTVTVDFSGVSDGYGEAGAISFTGADQFTVPHVAAEETFSEAGTNTLDITTSANNTSIVDIISYSPTFTGNPTADGSQTSIFSDSTSVNRFGMSYKTGVSSGANSMTWTWTQSLGSASGVHSAVAIKPATLITGKFYSDEGTTPLASKTISVSQDGAAITSSDTTDAGGEFTVALSGAYVGEVLTLFADNGSEDGITVVLGSGSTMTGVDIYQNRLIVRSESGSYAVTNAHLATADNSGDADITTILDQAFSTGVVIRGSEELFVWTGDTYQPGGRFSTHNFDLNGTLDLETNTGTVRGTFDMTGGSIGANSGTLILASASNESVSITNRVWNLQIEDTTEDSLVGYWKFDEGAGGYAYDSSANSNTGTLTNGPLWSGSTVSTITFDNPYSLNFDGTNDDVTISDTNDLSFGNSTSDSPFSASAWMLMDDATAFMTVGKGTTLTNAEWRVGTTSGDQYRAQLYDDQTGNQIRSTIDTSATSDEGTWVHIAFTYDGSGDYNGIVLYRNGRADTQTKESVGSYVAMHNKDAPVTIGSLLRDDATYKQFANGKIDDVRVYNKELNAQEIWRLANGRYANGEDSTSTFTLGADLDIKGNLSIQAGRLAGSSYTITSSGSWNNYAGSGSYVVGTSTVVLNGTGQVLTGTGSFGHLTKTVTSGQPLKWNAGDQFTVTGTLTLQGAASNLLALQSTTAGEKWLIDPQGTRTVTYLHVTDSNNVNATAVDCTSNCTDGGNTTNWNFAAAAVRRILRIF